MPRQPRYRDWVRTAPLDDVLRVHSTHVAAMRRLGVPMQSGAYFVASGDPPDVRVAWACECRWCDAVTRRLMVAEERYRLARLALQRASGDKPPLERREHSVVVGRRAEGRGDRDLLADEQAEGAHAREPSRDGGGA